MIFLLNKIDQVPEEAAKQWVSFYQHNEILCLKFKAIHTLSNEEQKEEDDNNESGRDKLMTVLFEYAKKFAEKKD